MEWLWPSIVKFCKELWSYTVALARLVVWVFVFFFTGLQRTLFMRSEIVGVEFQVMPIMCDREEFDDKLAYLDKLCVENPDLMGVDADSDFDDLMIDDEDNGEEDL
jgi:hypothetical protein